MLGFGPVAQSFLTSVPFLGSEGIELDAYGSSGASQMALMVKNLPANVGDVRDAGLVHGSGRSPGVGHDNPLQYSCLENPMDKGAWQATVHGVAKSWTRLKQLSMHTYTPMLNLSLA